MSQDIYAKVDKLEGQNAVLLAENATLRAAIQTHAEEAAKLIEQRDHLHAIVCATLAALGNGSGASKECSIEFLSNAPTEIGAVVSGLRAQRDELLADMKAALETLQRVNDTPYGAINDTIWHTRHETLFDFMDAAINKATNER